MDTLAIRLATADDAEAIAAIYEPIVRNTPISFEEEPPSVTEMSVRITEGMRRYPWFVADDGSVLGYAYATQHRSRAAYRWSAEVSAYVREDARRRSIARGLYEALFAMLKAQRFHRAYAGITLPNDASIALHRALGFEAVGIFREAGFKFGAWRDTSWWQLALSDGIPKGDPIALASLYSSPS